MNITYEVMVFNTLTGKEESVVVSKAVYDEYRRGEWRIDKNDAKYDANETPFSELIGGAGGAFENFHEFVNADHDPERLVMERMRFETLYEAVGNLSESDKRLVRAIYFDGKTEEAYAASVGVKQQTIHKKKHRILKELKNILCVKAV